MEREQLDLMGRGCELNASLLLARTRGDLERVESMIATELRRVPQWGRVTGSGRGPAYDALSHYSWLMGMQGEIARRLGRAGPAA